MRFHRSQNSKKPDAEESLDQLFNFFLIEKHKREDDYYFQHPLLAAWAIEKTASEKKQEILYSHYYLNLVKQNLHDTRILKLNWHHIKRGLALSFELELWGVLEQYIKLLQSIWDENSFYADAEIGFELGLKMANRLHNPGLKQFLLAHLGITYRCQARFDEAVDKLKNAQNINCENDDLIGVINFNLARSYISLNQYDEAQESLQLAWQAFQKEENLSKLGDTLFALADLHYYKGLYADANEFARQAHKTHLNQGNLIGQLNSLILLSTISQEEKNLDVAFTYMETSEKIISQINATSHLGGFYYSFGNLSRLQRRFTLANDQLEKSRLYYLRDGDLSALANTLNVKALLAFDWHEAEPDQTLNIDGIEAALESLALCKKIGYPLGEVSAGLSLGKLYAQTNEIEKAKEIWEETLELGKKLDNQFVIDRLQELLAALITDTT